VLIRVSIALVWRDTEFYSKTYWIMYIQTLALHMIFLSFGNLILCRRIYSNYQKKLTNHNIVNPYCDLHRPSAFFWFPCLRCFCPIFAAAHDPTPTRHLRRRYYHLQVRQGSGNLLRPIFDVGDTCAGNRSATHPALLGRFVGRVFPRCLVQII
jgi:hypothetical protein